MMNSLCNVEVIDSVKPTLAMVVVQSIYAVANILLKMAINDGMSLSVLVAYRCIFATAVIVPIAPFFERKSLQKLTGKVLFQGFLCGLLGGSLLHNLYVKSLALESATYATAMLNLIPAFTFVLALPLGLEKTNFGTAAGKAKLLGTFTGIGGAMILSFYKGRKIYIWSTHIDLLHHVASSPAATSSRLRGCTLSLATCLSYSLWLIVQAKMSEKFPWHYSIAALTAAASSIQAIIFALCTERDGSQWKLGWNLRLITVAFTGMLCSGLVYTLIAWCVRMKGPLFVSAFSPLMLVLVALAGPLVLDETLYFGSVIGAVLIVCGLYAVLWGKSRETSSKAQKSEVEGSVQSESIQICNQSDHGNKNVASVAPPNASNSKANHCSGKDQRLNISK